MTTTSCSAILILVNCTCPHCGRNFDVEPQQKRAIKARWAKEKNPAKRAAAARRQAQARWGNQVMLDFGKNKLQVPGYVKRSKERVGADYRLKGEKKWQTAPNGDLIAKTFYVYGR